jgi:hypothetical protein
MISMDGEKKEKNSKSKSDIYRSEPEPHIKVVQRRNEDISKQREKN